MILRRIASALKRQDWTTVFIEFALVILGVLIALQVNNWNEARLEAKEELRFLRQLQDEFAQIEKGAQNSLDFHRQALAGMSAVVKAIEDGRLEEEGRALFETGLRTGYVYQTSPDQSATLAEIISSGKVALLEDKELTRALLEYNALLDQLAQGVQTTRSIQAGYIPAFTARFTYDLKEDHEIGGDVWPVSAIGEYDFAAMVQDSAFRNAAYELRETQRYYLNWRTNVLKRIQEIRQILDNGETQT